MDIGSFYAKNGISDTRQQGFRKDYVFAALPIGWAAFYSKPKHRATQTNPFISFALHTARNSCIMVHAKKIKGV